MGIAVGACAVLDDWGFMNDESMLANQNIIQQAEREILEEIFRAAVEKHKAKLRAKKTLWDRVFPWRIVILRKGESNARR